MARKSTETVALTLRIREELRRKLERAAERNDVSLNNEMASRLEQSFQKEVEADLAAQIQDLRTENAQLVKSLQFWKDMPEIAASFQELMSVWRTLANDRTWIGAFLSLSDSDRAELLQLVHKRATETGAAETLTHQPKEGE
jgi:hypothetical protein